MEEEKYTKYEKARILGSRALQLAMGAPILIKLTEQELERVRYNPLEIAKMEFEKGIVPITVKRPMPKKEE
jgi:DNA-directed RNA polymerase subunit K/omega